MFDTMFLLVVVLFADRHGFCSSTTHCFTGRKGKKGKKGEDDAQQQQQTKFDVNTTDNRFTAMYNDSSYAIDPTDPRYKKTDNMKKIMEEKASRRRSEVLNGGVMTVDANQAQRQRKPTVPDNMLKKNQTETLVETLKRKHEEMDSKKRKKMKTTSTASGGSGGSGGSGSGSGDRKKKSKKKTKKSRM